MTFHQAIGADKLKGPISPSQWVMGPHVGVSSKTIWAAFMGVVPTHDDIPHDPDDFSRCWRLLQLIPEWRGKLSVVAEAFPYWKPFTDNWDELELLWYAEWNQSSAPRMYQRMRELGRQSDALRRAA